MIQGERYKLKVDGRQDWEEYHHGVQKEFLDKIKDKLKELAKEQGKREMCRRCLGTQWKAKLIKGTERGIGTLDQEVGSQLR